MTKRPDPFDLNLQSQAEVPTSFSWQGHRYVVETVLMHWVEAGPWWLSFRSPDPVDFDVTWHIWRVEAKSVVGSLVGDLAHRISITSSDSHPWRLVRVFD